MEENIMKIYPKKLKLNKNKRRIVKTLAQSYQDLRKEAAYSHNEKVEIKKRIKEPGMPGSKSIISKPTSSEAMEKIAVKERRKNKAKAAKLKCDIIKKALDLTLDNAYSGNETKKKKVRKLLNLVLFEGYKIKEAEVYGQMHDDCASYKDSRIRELVNLYYYFLNELLDELVLKGSF